MLRLGHYAGRAIGATLVITLLLTALSGLIPILVLLFYAPFAIVAVLVSWVALRKHARSLCATCASAMPLNPQKKAEANARSLKLCHVAQWKIFTYIGVVLLTSLLEVTLFDTALAVPVLLVWMAANVSLLYVFRAGLLHQSLQPWCPACRGDDGEHERTPSPAPVDGSLV